MKYLVIISIIIIVFAVVMLLEPKTVKLYYYNPSLDVDEPGNILCSRQGLVPVEREVVNEPVIENTIRLLFKGQLTETERTSGITTEYPLEGFSLEKANLSADGMLTLTFSDPSNKTVGGACRVGILWFQIEATAKQFSGVKSVRFWPEELFQP